MLNFSSRSVGAIYDVTSAIKGEPNLITISHCRHIYADLARNVARCREIEGKEYSLF